MANIAITRRDEFVEAFTTRLRDVYEAEGAEYIDRYILSNRGGYADLIELFAGPFLQPPTISLEAPSRSPTITRDGDDRARTVETTSPSAARAGLLVTPTLRRQNDQDALPSRPEGPECLPDLPFVDADHPAPALVRELGSSTAPAVEASLEANLLPTPSQPSVEVLPAAPSSPAPSAADPLEDQDELQD